MTTTQVQIPGQLIATYDERFETVTFAFLPSASDAGYFGPAAVIDDGPSIDVEDATGPFWTAVQQSIHNGYIGAEWVE